MTQKSLQTDKKNRQPEQTMPEQEIRAMIATWLEASKKGDLETLLNLMTEDVIFLTPGNSPMDRQDFIAGSKSMAGKISFEGHSRVQEITVTGDQAICWTHLEITVTPLTGGASVKRAGNTLSVLRRGLDGQWRIWRDANMLAIV
jgi:uncharacterized protein (TIGR02246 family)